VLHRIHDSDLTNANGQRCCPFDLVALPGATYIVHCNEAIAVAALLPFLGVSSLNFGPLSSGLFLAATLLPSCRSGLAGYSGRVASFGHWVWSPDSIGIIRCREPGIGPGEMARRPITGRQFGHMRRTLTTEWFWGAFRALEKSARGVASLRMAHLTPYPMLIPIPSKQPFRRASKATL
jgi:hypothetical protein